MSIDNLLELELKNGTVTIEMLPDLAPKHVAQIKHLVKENFYDGLTFHRVLDDFMVQGGSPTGDGTGSITATISEEFSDESHVRGICSMARGPQVDSASCQFFIILKDSSFLDKQYTIWGKVISGMEFVDNIKKGDSASNGVVKDPDKIVSMKLMTDKEIKIV